MITREFVKNAFHTKRIHDRLEAHGIQVCRGRILDRVSDTRNPVTGGTLHYKNGWVIKGKTFPVKDIIKATGLFRFRHLGGGVKGWFYNCDGKAKLPEWLLEAMVRELS